MSFPTTQNILPVRPVNIVVGHYGVGKTNFSLNWALDLRAQGKNVVLADFDIVNPYFRSSDYTALMQEAGVRVIAPVLAGSSLDTPSISGAVGIAIEQAYAHAGEDDATVVIIDAGGDDAGATVLGRFSSAIQLGPYQMLYVVNRYRNLTQEPAQACEILTQIEEKSHLKATGLVNNSHLRDATDSQTILDALAFGHACSSLTGLELVCTTAPKMLLEPNNPGALPGIASEKIYPVSKLVKTPWE